MGPWSEKHLLLETVSLPSFLPVGFPHPLPHPCCGDILQPRRGKGIRGLHTWSPESWRFSSDRGLSGFWSRGSKSTHQCPLLLGVQDK